MCLEFPCGSVDQGSSVVNVAAQAAAQALIPGPGISNAMGMAKKITVCLPITFNSVL